MQNSIRALLQDKQIKAQIISFLSGNFSAVVNFLTHLLIIRTLTVMQYSEFSTIVSTPGILYSYLSFIPYLVIAAIGGRRKNDEESGSHLKELFKSYISLSFYWTILLLLTAPIIANYLHIESNGQLYLLFITLFITSVFNYISAVFLALGDFRIGFANFSAAIIKLTFILVGFKFFSKSIWIPLIGETICFTSITLVLWKTRNLFFFPTHFNFLVSPKKAFSLLYQAKGHILNVFILGSISTLDIVFCRKFLSPQESGMVIGGINLAKILFFFSNPINLVLFYFAKNDRESEKGSLTSLIKSLVFCGAGLFVGGIAIYYFRHFLIQKLYGAAYLPIEPILYKLLIYVSLIAIVSLIINFLMSIQKHRFVLYCFFSYFAGYIYLFSFSQIDHIPVVDVFLLISASITSLCLTEIFLYALRKNPKEA